MKKETPPVEERSVLSLIRDIQSGSLNPKVISLENRRRCVEHLTGEGYSRSEIAEVLGTSERTIARDRGAIREANAIERDPGLVTEMVGDLVRQADISISRIRRVTRDKSTLPAAKIDGEKACWNIARDLVDSLQRLGYLPTAATEITGELTHHHLEALPDLVAMQDELARLDIIARSSGVNDPAIRDQITEIKSTVTRLVLTEQMEQLENALPAPNAEEQFDDHPTPE